jgi:hypothetical protein
MQPLLKLKTRPKARPVSLSLSMAEHANINTALRKKWLGRY